MAYKLINTKKCQIIQVLMCMWEGNDPVLLERVSYNGKKLIDYEMELDHQKHIIKDRILKI